ncbi:hypothetical protein EQG49_03015 [Periweissella cryptocerci]|uniref:Lipocalin-like domain-containing protein n=1 Tax=Periweissella cryptocerci TaxID=2506420 RepID=A0A4P6YS43_9LACO|nr:hypothetical protein [Periweissella cryptocerci]QBO35498.1 hypothetical protein EQG49_03015 [Periweissella cryptocerci]
MKMTKKITTLLMVITMLAAVCIGSVSATMNVEAAQATASKKAPKKVKAIHKSLRGTWYFFDKKNKKHTMKITKNTLKIDNKTNKLGKGGFNYYSSKIAGSNVHQLGINYSDYGFSFRTKKVKIGGKKKAALLMISADYTGTRVLTKSKAHKVNYGDFFK